MNEDREVKGTIQNTAKATGIVSIAVMMSRVLGLLRDKMLAHLFGLSVWADCFQIAFRIPNLLRDLFAEGALSQAFVTTFSKKIKEEGEESAWALANRVLSLALVVISLVTIIGIIFAPQIVDLLMLGAKQKNVFGETERNFIIILVRIMYPFIIIVSLSALVMGMLNAKNVFGVPALASCFFNLGSMIGGGIIGYIIDPDWGKDSLLGISVGVLIGGLAQLIWQFPALWKIGYRPRWDTLWNDSGVKKVIKLMGPAVIASSAVQVNVTVNTIFAGSVDQKGVVTALNFAFRLMQLPIGMFGVAIASVTLPALARSAVGGVGNEFRCNIARGASMITILVLPSTVGLAMLASPLISMIYQGGQFTAKDTSQTAQALQCYSYGLIFYSWIKIIQPAFYTIDRRWIPMMVSFLAMGLNFALNWFFIVKMKCGFQYLALTTSVLAFVNFIILYVSLSKIVGGLKTFTSFTTLWKCGIAASVMAGFCWLANRFILHDITSHHVFVRWTLVVMVIAVVAFIYLTLCYLLRVKEARECSNMILRRIPGLKRFTKE
jgi:putative peptidoglycan lipid II flippase